MQSPYQVMFGTIPEVKHLKIFGTTVYPLLRPFNKHKLEPRSTQCVFLGFAHGYKGVICYDIKTRKFILSRHVIHDEDVYPFKQSLPHQDSITDYRPFQTPVLVQLQVPSSRVISDAQVHHNSQAVSSTTISADSTSPHPSIPSNDVNENWVGPLNEFSISSTQELQTSDSSANLNDITNLHHSPTPHHSGTQSLLPVHSESQLEVVLPDLDLSSSDVSSHTVPSTHSMVTRLKSGTIERQNYAALIVQCPELNSLQITEEEPFTGGYSFISEITDSSEPTTFRKAATLPQWQKAMQEEYDSLRAQGTWLLVPPPENRAIVGSKWVYKVKKNPDGSISRYKARLVAQGFSQEHGIDYLDTFSPVVRHTTVRIILALAAMNHWTLRQLDIKNAFLHGDLQEEVYMKQPQGFIDPSYPSHVCKLVKSLYGLKQAPRAWNSKFTSYLAVVGFHASASDTSLFVKKDESDITILLLYVDDIILTGSNPVKIQTVIQDLSTIFELKDLGQLTYFLGLQVQYKTDGSVFVSQSKYIKDLVHKAGMDSCKPANTPCKPHHQMLQSEGQLLTDPTVYRSIVGSLQYLTFTRPDIAFAVNTVCQFMSSPTDIHFGAVKRIIRYLQGTMHIGINFSADTVSKLTAFSDSDWAADLNTRRYVVYLGNNPISWQSKKQNSVSRSSTEAEYKALAHTAADIAWIRYILKDLGVFLDAPPTIHCDNMSAIALSANPVFHSRIKHLDTDYHFVRERVQQGDLEVLYIPTEEQTADVLTKGLHSPSFVKHFYNLKLANPS